jgi:hypothetical protein
VAPPFPNSVLVTHLTHDQTTPQEYRTFSVADASSESGACCSACAEDHKCVSWLVFTKKKSTYKAGTCECYAVLGFCRRCQISKIYKFLLPYSSRVVLFCKYKGGD